MSQWAGKTASTRVRSEVAEMPRSSENGHQQSAPQGHSCMVCFVRLSTGELIQSKPGVGK